MTVVADGDLVGRWGLQIAVRLAARHGGPAASPNLASLRDVRVTSAQGVVAEKHVLHAAPEAAPVVILGARYTPLVTLGVQYTPMVTITSRERVMALVVNLLDADDVQC